MQEDEYRKRFNIVANDMMTATSDFYTYREINQFAPRDGSIPTKSIGYIIFWDGSAIAKQSTWFIVFRTEFRHQRVSFAKIFGSNR